MVVETVCAILIPIIASFVFKLIQHRRQKLQWKGWVAQQDKQRQAEQMQREWDQASMRQQQVRQDQARQAEKDREKQQQQAHKQQVNQDQARQAKKEREKQKQDEIKQAWIKANIEKAARETKKTREKKKQEQQQQAEPERKKDAEWKREILEELRQAKEQQDKEFQNLKEDLQKKIKEVDIMKNMVKQGIQLFLHFLRRLRQSPHGHHFRIQSSEYQSYEDLLASSGLIEELGNDEAEIHGIFNASLLQIEDKPGNSTVGASSSSPSLNYSKELALLEIPEQIPEGFENDILSLVMTTINGETLPTEEDNAEYKQYNDALREEGNAYFKDKNFTEAIKSYAMSIDHSPTAAAYANRAMAYIKLGKFNEAEKDCTEALKIDGRYFKAYARRAMCRKECRRDLYGALDDVDEALKLESSNQDMKALRSELCKELSSR